MTEWPGRRSAPVTCCVTAGRPWPSLASSVQGEQGWCCPSEAGERAMWRLFAGLEALPGPQSLFYIWDEVLALATRPDSRQGLPLCSVGLSLCS